MAGRKSRSNLSRLNKQEWKEKKRERSHRVKEGSAIVHPTASVIANERPGGRLPPSPLVLEAHVRRDVISRSPTC